MKLGYKWKILGLLLCTGALNYADRAAIASVFPLLQADLRMSDVEMGAVGASFLWAYAPGSLLGGILADRRSRSRIITISLGVWSLITLGTGLVTSVHQLLWTRSLLGLAEASYVPAAIGLIADYHDSRTRATAIGIYSAGSAIGVVGGGFTLAYLGERLGWRLGFVALGLAGLALAALAFLVLHDAPAEPRRSAAGPEASPSRLLALLGIPSMIAILFAMLIVAVGNQTFLNWLPLYYRETHHLSLTRASVAGTLMLQGAGITGGLLGGVFSDRVAGANPRRRMLIQIVCTIIAAPFLLVFFLQGASLLLLNTCIGLFSFVMVFGTSNVTPLTCDLLPPQLRSTAIGLGNLANCLAGSAGVMAAGLLKSGAGLGSAFGRLSCLNLLCAAILFLGYRFFLERDLARRPKLEMKFA